MKFVLVFVLLACALSLTIKDRMETATVEELRSEVAELRAQLETFNVLRSKCTRLCHDGYKYSCCS